MSDDAWSTLRGFTDARIGLGRTGVALPTREVLRFALAHARARDAVHRPIDWTPLADGLRALGLAPLRIDSAAVDRDTYLRRPDLGRRLDDASRARIVALRCDAPDLALLVGDGLSAAGVAAHALPFLRAFLPLATGSGWRLAPPLLAGQARVALGDTAAELLGARAVLVLIGERPGLSSPDSLGAYLTYAPRIGCRDSERNCISNIRAAGLAPEAAALRAHWLLGEMLRRRLSGVMLKDESDGALPSQPDQP